MKTQGTFGILQAKYVSALYGFSENMLFVS